MGETTGHFIANEKNIREGSQQFRQNRGFAHFTRVGGRLVCFDKGRHRRLKKAEEETPDGLSLRKREGRQHVEEIRLPFAGSQESPRRLRRGKIKNWKKLFSFKHGLGRKKSVGRRLVGLMVGRNSGFGGCRKDRSRGKKKKKH